MTADLCARCMHPQADHIDLLQQACPNTPCFTPAEMAAVKVLASSIADVPNDSQQWVVERGADGWMCTALETWKALNP